MRFTACRGDNSSPRCFTPLIEICDSTTQIKLDLGSCGICADTPTAIFLKKAGCPEFETVCEEVEPPKCGCCPSLYPCGRMISREIPKPSITYPLLEIDPTGMSVFALDNKLNSLGYGRYNGVVLINDEPSPIEFDVEYVPYMMGINNIQHSVIQPNLQEC